MRGRPSPAQWLRRRLTQSTFSDCVWFQTPGLLPVANPKPGVNPLSSGTNPCVLQGMSFTIYNDVGGTAASKQSEIRKDGGYTGLNCGYRLDIELPVPAHLVRLKLVHFAHRARMLAFDAQGAQVWTDAMTAPAGAPEGFYAYAKAIRRMRIIAMQNEVLLLDLCFQV